MTTSLHSSQAITVIIPVYNGLPYVQRTLLSVINQTLKPTEIIVVNDGSTDQTAQELEKIKNSYPDFNIQIISKPNGGHSSATNVGIRASTSEFIALVDADDLWHPTKLEKQMLVFNQSSDPKLGVVYTNFMSIDPDDALLPDFPSVQLDPQFKGRVFELLITKGCFIVGSNSAVLIKRKAFLEHGFFDENLRCGEDWEMWIRISQTYHYDFHPDVLTYIRRHSGNLSNQKLIHLRSDLYIINKWKKQFRDVGGLTLIVDYLSRTTITNQLSLILNKDFSLLRNTIKDTVDSSFPRIFVVWALLRKIRKRINRTFLGPYDLRP